MGVLVCHSMIRCVWRVSREIQLNIDGVDIRDIGDSGYIGDKGDIRGIRDIRDASRSLAPTSDP